jgi:hypothetical protein
MMKLELIGWPIVGKSSQKQQLMRHRLHPRGGVAAAFGDVESRD